MESLGISVEEADRANEVINTSVRSFQDEVASRMTEVDSGIEGVTEYFVPAFPEEAQKMREDFEADLANAVGPVYAVEIAKILDAVPWKFWSWKV
jgi:hypothetical protein